MTYPIIADDFLRDYEKFLGTRIEEDNKATLRGVIEMMNLAHAEGFAAGRASGVREERARRRKKVRA